MPGQGAVRTHIWAALSLQAHRVCHRAWQLPRNWLASGKTRPGPHPAQPPSSNPRTEAPGAERVAAARTPAVAYAPEVSLLLTAAIAHQHHRMVQIIGLPCARLIMVHLQRYVYPFECFAKACGVRGLACSACAVYLCWPKGSLCRSHHGMVCLQRTKARGWVAACHMQRHVSKFLCWLVEALLWYRLVGQLPGRGWFWGTGSATTAEPGGAPTPTGPPMSCALAGKGSPTHPTPTFQGTLAPRASALHTLTPPP